MKPANSSIHCANSEADYPATWHNELATGVSVSGAIGVGVDYLQYASGELQ